MRCRAVRQRNATDRIRCERSPQLNQRVRLVRAVWHRKTARNAPHRNRRKRTVKQEYRSSDRVGESTLATYLINVRKKAQNHAGFLPPQYRRNIHASNASGFFHACGFLLDHASRRVRCCCCTADEFALTAEKDGTDRQTNGLTDTTRMF